MNALLCSVRRSDKDDLRYCFDLISPQQRTYTLQAESEEELEEWISVHGRHRGARRPSCI